MGTRSAWATASFIVLLAGSAIAGPKEDIAAKSKEAMESYDLMDYDAAKKLLNQALATAKKAKLDRDPVTAKVYLELGIAAFAAGDTEAARVAFLSAVQIDSKIQISVAYKTPDLTKLLDEARSEASGGGSSPEPVDAGVDCASVKGLQHTIIDTAPAGAPVAIEALVGLDITPIKVAVMYRAQGATDFTEVKLTKQGDCKYVGAIPKAAIKGELVHYYVAALNEHNKAIAAKGSSGSPNLLEISGVAAVTTNNDTEDPIGGGEQPTGGGEVSGGVVAGGKPPKVMIAVSGGTGFGIVTGNTEGGNMVQSCPPRCVGNSLVVITPELGYYVTRKLSIGVAARLGLPIGANVNAENAEGHSTIAPAGLLRIRYALSASGQGVRVMGQVGGGVMRNTIELETTTAGMDTDIVAQGPILIGAGIGFTKNLSGNFAFIADFSALVGIALGDKLGTTRVNTGFGADLSLGLAVGF